MQKNFSSNRTKKGYTFVEVIVTMAVMVGVIMAVTGIFRSSTKSYRKAALTQQDLEQAQFAMNLMNKVLRTGFVTAPAAANTPSSLFVNVYDKSQDKCVRFEFDNYKLKTSSRNVSDPNDDDKTKIDFCKTAPLPSAIEITNTHVDSGSFDVTPTVIDAEDKIGSIGKVTIMMTICPIAGCDESKKVRMQSTVSHRIYKEISPTF